MRTWADTRRQLRHLQRKLKPFVEPTKLHWSRFEWGMRAAYGNVYKELSVVIAMMPKSRKRKS